MLQHYIHLLAEESDRRSKVYGPIPKSGVFCSVVSLQTLSMLNGFDYHLQSIYVPIGSIQTISSEERERALKLIYGQLDSTSCQALGPLMSLSSFGAMISSPTSDQLDSALYAESSGVSTTLPRLVMSSDSSANRSMFGTKEEFRLHNFILNTTICSEPVAQLRRLRALQVPPLPLDLGCLKHADGKSFGYVEVKLCPILI